MKKLEGYINFWPEFIQGVHMTEEAICVIYSKKQVVIRKGKKTIELPTYEECKTLIKEEQVWYLGRWQEIPCFAYEIDSAAELPEALGWTDFLEDRWNQNQELYCIAIKAEHLLNWDRSSKYCGYCGDINERKKNERAKICPGCGNILYPRISPAIIVGIKKDGKLLMAHNAGFKKDLYSIIAGFVEQGESLEAAVKREVYEEIGIKVKNIEYYKSKPWDSLDSLMFGFIAEYESGEIKVDGKEIVDAGWYDAEHLPPELPKKITIARSIIDHVLGLGDE